MPKKLRVGVMMGGPGSEREISLITGKRICANLDQKKYEVIPIEVTKKGQMIMHKMPKLLDEKATKNLLVQKGKEMDLTSEGDKGKLDMVFIAMHGIPGESGDLQGMLECLGIPYTGSQTLASALTMNKVFAAQIYFANGLPTPTFVHFKKDGWKDRRDAILNDVKNKIGYPAFVKPVDQGSSVGVKMVRNEKELVEFVDPLIKKFSWLMAQKFIKGQEATCGVLEKDGQVFPLPPTHILANLGEFYDFKSKYKAGGSTHICPADFGHEINEKIQALAVQAHRALGCRGMSRTDVFVADDGQLWVIETNTIPGMTPVSLLPQASEAMGILYSEMLDLIIEASL